MPQPTTQPHTLPGTNLTPGELLRLIILLCFPPWLFAAGIFLTRLVPLPADALGWIATLAAGPAAWGAFISAVADGRTLLGRPRPPDAPKRWWGQVIRVEATAESSVAIGGNVNHSAISTSSGAAIAHMTGDIIQVYTAPPGRRQLSDAEVARMLAEYLRWVGNAYDTARLFGLESAPVQRPYAVQPLTDIFIPVTLRRFNPPDRRELAEKLSDKTGLDALLAWRALNQAEGRAGETVPLAKLLTVSAHLAIVGGAGCGKSTVLAYLAATLARAAQTGERLPYELPRLKPLVPLIVPLRYYRDYLEKCCQEGGQIDDPRRGTLAGFIPWYLRHRSPILEASEDFFDRLLLGGGCLMMIDGLDEITSREQRGQVREEVERLIRDIYPGNLVIVTAREAGYVEEAVFGAEFTRLDVLDLDDDQIAALVGNWCCRLPEQYVGKAADLVAAIVSINELRRERALSPLISTPLMVTMVVGVRFGATELPRDRARLYEACVRAILQAQYIPSDAAREELINWGGPWETQWEWLSDLALAMHAGGPSNAAVREEQVRAALQGKLAADALEAFLRAVRRRGGLFEERGEFFQFSHLTFQEFLAARVLAKQREAARPLLAQYVGDSWWREVFLLVYGCLRMDYKPPAEAYLGWLAHLAGDGDTRLAGAELAGAAVMEIEQPDPSARRKQAGRLVELLQDKTLSVSGVLRAATGRTLARLGDPRRGVGLTLAGLPDIAWCDVPAGEFIMGSDEFDDEKPPHQLTLPAFQISEYPITNTQFAAFVQDGGYISKWRHCWTDTGWKWKGGRTEPDRAGGAFDLSNHPVVMVTWHEAAAFCNWLGEKLGFKVSLPTEVQWEKAASWEEGNKEISRQGPAGRKRRYPWGDQITPDHANYDETGIGATTAVGIFPKGKSPYGALDMGGNVWEWCLTKWRENYEPPPDDDLAGDAWRVLRGGAYYSDQNRVRRACRLRNFSAYRGVNSGGFRVVRSSR